MRNILVALCLASAVAACSDIVGTGHDRPKPADYDIRLRIDSASVAVGVQSCGQMYCYVTECATGMIGGTLHIDSSSTAVHAASVTMDSVSYSGTVTITSTSLVGQLGSSRRPYPGDIGFTASLTGSSYVGTWNQYTDPHGAIRRGTFAATLASSTPPPIEDPRATTVTGVVISPSAATAVRVGGTIQLTAQAVNLCGGAVPGQTYTWSTSNSSVATVASSGIVTGVGAGSATITASSAGKTATKTIYVLSADTLAASAVYAGDGRTCALVAGGAAQCWGLVVGAAGDSVMKVYTYPVGVGGGQNFTSLAVGGGQFCGITPGALGYCWGTNSSGELGDGTRAFRTGPTAIAGGLSFASISAGGAPTFAEFDELYSCGIATTGTVACWGSNGYGQLGAAPSGPLLTPSAVSGLSSVTSLATSFKSSCAVSTNGAAFCWGDNTNGQLGDGTTSAHSAPAAVTGGLTFRSIAGGGAAFCGLATDSTAYCWGGNQAGILGPATIGSYSSTPVSIANGSMKFTQVTVGALHACGLTAAGDAYCWGGNYYGSLGDGTTTNRSTPTLVSGGLHFSSIAAGGNHTCGRTTAGQVFCWGANANGELGDLSTTQRNVPVPVSAGPPNQ